MYDGLDALPWWDREGEDLTTTLVGVERSIRADDGSRRIRYRVWDDLYDGQCWLNGGGISEAAYDYVTSALGDVSFNYAARALDFVHAKLTAEMPAVRAAGHDADHRQYLRAKALSRFLVGASADVGMDEQLADAVKCALRVGTAGILAEVSDGCPRLEAVHPRELLVDPDDARHGDPRVLYRIRPTDRRLLLDHHPDRADDIRAAGTAGDRSAYDDRTGDWTTPARFPDSVDVYEAWVLPDSQRSGRHVRCIESGPPLLDEEWTDPRFPIAVFRAWTPATGNGWFGRGLMERLDTAQFAIDELVRHVDESMKHSNLKVFLPDETEVVADGILDDPTVGTIIRTTGQGVPQFVTPSVLGPGREAMAVIAEWRSSLYQIAGLDEAAVSSQRPAGVDSAIAIRTYHDFQSQGYVDMMRRIGVLAVDVAERLIDAAHRAFGGETRRRLEAELSDAREAGDDESAERLEAELEATDWEVRYSRGGSGVAVRWSDVMMDRDKFVIELEETSPVPDSRSGRLQEVEEDAANNRIPPEYLTRLREDPDRWWMERCNAQEDVDYVDWIVDELMDSDRPMPRLLDEMDAGMAVDRLRREVLAAVRLGRPDDVVTRLQAFLAQVVDSQSPPDDGSSGGAAPAPALPPMTPQAPAGPPQGPPPQAPPG